MHESLETIAKEAREAKFTADRAYDIAKSVDGHLTTISASLDGMRQENTRQHADNKLFVAEQLGVINTRISAVKASQDFNRETYLGRMDAMEINIKDNKHIAEVDVLKAKDIATQSAAELKQQASRTAVSILWKLLGVMALIIAGLIGALTHGRLQINP